MKILIWGIGGNTKAIGKEIGWKFKEYVEILAYIDSNAKPNMIFQGKKVILPEQIERYEYDYILVISQYIDEIQKRINELKIEKSEVKFLFERNHKLMFEELYSIEKENYNKLLLKLHQPDMIITGTSYHMLGIDVKCFKNLNVDNFALSSQDLFYDYMIVRWLYENKLKEMKKVRNCIVGISYYSFEYDFSLSVNKERIIRYYPYIMDGHHFLKENEFEGYAKKRLEELEESRVVLDLFTPIVSEACVINEQNGQIAATRDFNKNYPETIRENIRILENYLNFLLLKK